MSEVDPVVSVETVTEYILEEMSETVATVDVIAVDSPEQIVETLPLIDILETSAIQLITDVQDSVSVVTEGMQGPPGPPGLSEEDVVYTKRIDMVSDTVIYKGEAAVGSAESDPVWRIRKIVIALDGDVAETWASGTAAFQFSWDDHLTLTYI